MPFDTKRFMRQSFQPRTAEVAVPALAQWFYEDGDKDVDQKECVFVVRGLTGNELARTIEAADRVKNIDTVLQAIGNNREKIDQLREVVGISDETPAEIIKRLQQLEFGSVEPRLELNVAVRLAEAFPIEFYLLTNQITRLTGQGMDLKK